MGRCVGGTGKLATAWQQQAQGWVEKHAQTWFRKIVQIHRAWEKSAKFAQRRGMMQVSISIVWRVKETACMTRKQDLHAPSPANEASEKCLCDYRSALRCRHIRYGIFWNDFVTNIRERERQRQSCDRRIMGKWLGSIFADGERETTRFDIRYYWSQYDLIELRVQTYLVWFGEWYLAWFRLRVIFNIWLANSAADSEKIWRFCNCAIDCHCNCANIIRGNWASCSEIGKRSDWAYSIR